MDDFGDMTAAFGNDRMFGFSLSPGGDTDYDAPSPDLGGFDPTSAVLICSSGAIVSSGEVIDDAVIASGGKVSAYGELSGTTAGGRLNLLSGADIAETAVVSGGRLTVSVGAAATSTAILDGGWMGVQSGGAAEFVGIASGGILRISSGGVVRGLAVASGATAYASSGAVIDFDLTARTPEDAAIVNDLSLVQGAPDFTITVSAYQTNGTYLLADGAADFAQTVTICNTDGVCGSFTVGETVELSGETYTLDLADSLLTLTAAGGTPPPVPVILAGAAGDLNADGRADIVMTVAQEGHDADGSTGAWLIQEDQTAAWGDLSQRGEGREIFGTGRTAAGKLTADVYVKSSDNVIGAWTTGDDGQVTGWETIGEFSSDTEIVGLGDFNGSGQTDLLLRNANGAVGCFFTDGEGWNYFQSLGDEWKLSAIGDLNGDGRDDVVLKHDAGFAGSWLTQADGTMAWADLDTLPEGFAIVGAGDFDGDGTDDLRIRTAAGDLGSQLVKGADTLQWKYYGSVGDEWSTSLAAL